MKAVLYTQQLEPITVVDLPMWALEKLGKGEYINIPVPLPPVLVPGRFPEPVDLYREQRVVIHGERFTRRGCDVLMLFTNNEETALMLKAAFLPGQEGEVQNRQAKAFASGFLRAIQTM